MARPLSVEAAKHTNVHMNRYIC